jgi:hypothetical protein
MKNNDTRKTADEVIIDYLREEGDLPPADPDGVVSAVIVKARRARFAAQGEQKTRLTLAEKEADQEELAALSASSWALVSELPRDTDYSHLLRSGEELWVAQILWL